MIHVEGFGLLLLGKTCRLCLRCDTLLVHKAELDDLLRTKVSVQDPKYVVLGTLERHVYRRGLAGGVSLDDVKKHMADFKSYWKVDMTPAGIRRTDGLANIRLQPAAAGAIMSRRG